MIFYLTYILTPLILSNVLHMWVVKRNYLAFSAVPIHKNWFGENKTWRGFAFVSLANLLILWMMLLFFPADVNPWLGALFGAVYMLAELPNSWLKRKMGIKPGATPSRGAFFFKLIDKMDSSLGVALTACVCFPYSLSEFGLIFLVNVLIHSLFSLVLYMVHLKKSF